MKPILAFIVLWAIFTLPLLSQDTIPVYTGWNNIGSLGSGSVPDLVLTEPPGIILTSFFGYAPGAGYQSADTLRKGAGYWIKVAGDGIIIFGGPGHPDSCGTKTVPYGGMTYHTIQIGNQCWLKENMNIGAMIDGTSDQTDNAVIEKYCYNDDTLDCSTHGGLYQWGEAVQYTADGGVQGICPAGWHIPLGSEFAELSSSVGGEGNALKELGEGSGSGAGTNASGFSGLLAGERIPEGIEGNFYYRGFFAFLWTSSEYDATSANFLRLYHDSGLINLNFMELKTNGFSVRCLEN